MLTELLTLIVKKTIRMGSENLILASLLQSMSLADWMAPCLPLQPLASNIFRHNHVHIVCFVCLR